MIRYRYVTHLDPPAPFVNVSVQCPTTGRQAAGLAAQVDTAADRTVLPAQVVAALGLVEVGRFLIEGFGGHIIELPTYLVAVRIHDLPAVEVRAVLGEREPYILMGRDVLNGYRLLLDGPKLALEIELPVTGRGAQSSVNPG
jgi:hypothetical protein